MVTVKELVDLLVEKEWERKKAESKVKAVQAKIKEMMPKESEEVRMDALRMAINQLVRTGKTERFEGICIAPGQMRDMNEPARRKALEIYEQDALRAVQDKFVMMKDGKPIALDTREYLDAGKTMKNRAFGKPLPESQRREAFFTIEGAITRVFGVFDCVLGTKYEIFGVKAQKGYINVPERPGVRSLGVIDPKELWTLVDTAAQNSEYAIALSEVQNADKSKILVTKGAVRAIRQNPRGSMMVLEDEETPDGVVCFSLDNDELSNTIDAYAVGTEVIALGRMSRSVDAQQQERFSIMLSGVVSNPESEKIVNVLKGLDSVLYD